MGYKFLPGNILINTSTNMEVSLNDYEYTQWLDQGNIPEPIYSLEVLRQSIIENISKKSSNITSIIGDDKEKIRLLTRAVELIYRKITSSLSQEEETELVNLYNFSIFVHQLDLFINLEESWVKSPERTYSELETYDVENPFTGQWPTI